LIDRFKGVATKYLDNYLVWFQFLEMKGFDATTSNFKEVFVNTSPCEHQLTIQQIRQSKFSLESFLVKYLVDERINLKFGYMRVSHLTKICIVKRNNLKNGLVFSEMWIPVVRK
jgi:hypothetical protein